MKKFKLLCSVFLTICFGISILPQTVSADVIAKNYSAKAASVSRVSYEDDNFGQIDVKFSSKVQWKRNAKVKSIKDNKGKSYKGYIIDKDDDDCEIYIPKLKYNRTYTIKISGVKSIYQSSYQTVTAKVKIPSKSKSLRVKEIEYDADYDDGRMEYTVSFEFNKYALHKGSSYIIIEDSSGRTYSSKHSYIDWDEDECELYLSGGLEYGKKYNYKIVNVKGISDKKYYNLTGSFTAY